MRIRARGRGDFVGAVVGAAVGGKVGAGLRVA